MSKYILIIGGSSGIGLELTKLLLKKNINVISTFNKTEKNLSLLKKSFTNLIVYKIDLKNAQEIKNMFLYFQQEDIQISGLVNSAGDSLYSLLIDTKPEDISSIININLTSTILTTQSAIKNMLSHEGGKIINISSIWGLYGASCESIYSATKGGIIAFTKSIAKEYASANITATVIAPGPVNTKMLNSFTEEERRDIASMSALNKIAKPSEIAEIIYSVLSDNSKLYNGSVIEISGTLI